MYTNAPRDDVQPGRRCQYNLATLMFATFVVALCATLIRISPAVGVMALPLVAAALVRTMRARRRSRATENPNQPAAGLFGTFCTSTGIVFSLILMSFVAASVACVALALVVVGVTVRVCWPAVIAITVVCVFLCERMRAAWHWLRPRLPTLSAKTTFVWARGHAVTRAAQSVRANRRLLARFWYPEAARSA